MPDVLLPFGWPWPRGPTFPSLTQNQRADVCIVGAGMAGLTTAYLLTKAGKTVIVLDDGPIFSGETERTTAHLVTVLDKRYFELEHLHGEGGAKLAAESHATAIDTIERIVREERIDCDFERVDGYLFSARINRRTSWSVNWRRPGTPVSRTPSWSIACQLFRLIPAPHCGSDARLSFIP